MQTCQILRKSALFDLYFTQDEYQLLANGAGLLVPKLQVEQFIVNRQLLSLMAVPAAIEDEILGETVILKAGSGTVSYHFSSRTVEERNLLRSCIYGVFDRQSVLDAYLQQSESICPRLQNAVFLCFCGCNDAKNHEDWEV